MSTNDPEAIRADIDRTRNRLGEDVDVLTESVRPSSVARRGADRVSDRAGRLRDTVMGSHDGSSASGARERGAEAVHGATGAARRNTRGNPLAAGAVALAAGWLVGSLLPASSAERQLASQAKEKAEPLLDEARSTASESAHRLQEPAKEAAGAVTDRAKEGAQNVRHEAGSGSSGSPTGPGEAGTASSARPGPGR